MPKGFLYIWMCHSKGYMEIPFPIYLYINNIKGLSVHGIDYQVVK